MRPPSCTRTLRQRPTTSEPINKLPVRRMAESAHSDSVAELLSQIQPRPFNVAVSRFRLRSRYVLKPRISDTGMWSANRPVVSNKAHQINPTNLRQENASVLKLYLQR